MATHSCIPASEILWTEEPGRLQSMGSQELETTWQLNHKGFDCVEHNKLWKILQEMHIQDHCPASSEICMQVRKQQLELDMEQQTGSK